MSRKMGTTNKISLSRRKIFTDKFYSLVSMPNAVKCFTTLLVFEGDISAFYCLPVFIVAGNEMYYY